MMCRMPKILMCWFIAVPFPVSISHTNRMAAGFHFHTFVFFAEKHYLRQKEQDEWRTRIVEDAHLILSTRALSPASTPPPRGDLLEDRIRDGLIGSIAERVAIALQIARLLHY